MELEDEISIRSRKICHHALIEVGGELLGGELGGRIYFFVLFLLFYYINYVNWLYIRFFLIIII